MVAPEVHDRDPGPPRAEVIRPPISAVALVPFVCMSGK